jgi:hypothetical protein
VLSVQALGHERAVARLGIALDAEEGGRRVAWELRHERAEVERVEDLTGVALDVLGREGDAVALAHALAVVLAVLELAQPGRRRQLNSPGGSHAGWRPHWCSPNQRVPNFPGPEVLPARPSRPLLDTAHAGP